MAKFVYRMQSILSVKEKLENQSRNEFAVAAAKVNEEEEKLSAMEARRNDYENHLRELCESSLDVRLIKEAEDSVELMKYHIRIQSLAVAAAKQQLEVARQKLTVAIQDRKTHEKLKEKEFDAFKAEEAAKESKAVDELVSFRHKGV